MTALQKLSPWQARMLPRITRADAAYATIVLSLAILALWSGRAAARHLSPDGAHAASELLDELELPTVLPNAPLGRDDGDRVALWDLTTEPRTIINFYAPWCGPCQTELPALVKSTADHPQQLAVVVGADEDPVDVRKALDNLGLQNVRFHVDATRHLADGARVTALPTTFLVGRQGRVKERIVGYSEFRLQVLI